MDNNFQTSFIPKKPLAEERVSAPARTSILSLLATLLFFGSLASAAGMYFYKASLVKSISSMSTGLDAARNSFEPSLITTLQKLDRRISDANQLLGSHIVVSPIFDALQINTLKTVQFTKFSYITPVDLSAPVVVHMSGKGKDYASVALQSDQLAMNKNIHNSIFSNLTLDEQTGMVAFDLAFTVDSDLVRFANHLTELTSQQGTTTQTSGSTTGTQNPSAGSNSSTFPVSSGTTGGSTQTGTGAFPVSGTNTNTGNTTPPPATGGTQTGGGTQNVIPPDAVPLVPQGGTGQ